MSDIFLKIILILIAFDHPSTKFVLHQRLVLIKVRDGLLPAEPATGSFFRMLSNTKLMLRLSACIH
jgi:hypothetical protein